ncbi:hypothetical protein [Methylomonas sp. CM2]|uniref:hypothetical protein n=1 Tax=Methylomonas sp. CM2 TaxID=3417647 RepID=UPI003CE9DFDB
MSINKLQSDIEALKHSLDIFERHFKNDVHHLLASYRELVNLQSDLIVELQDYSYPRKTLNHDLVLDDDSYVEPIFNDFDFQGTCYE